MRVGIFGAGQAGAMVSRWLAAGQELICYIDNNTKKQGTMMGGIPVCPLEEALAKKLDVIWLAVLNKEASARIREQILAGGYAGEVNDVLEFRGKQDIRLAALRLAAGEVKEREVSGALAELGVYRGEFAAEMNRLFPERKIYLFDTFEGFDERDIKIEERKDQGAGAAARKRDFTNTSMELVREALPYPEQAVFCKGYFPESMKNLEHGLPRLALVSLDPDLYEPVYRGLQVFYPLLNPGGVILIHDYNSMQYPGVKKAVRRFCEEEHLYVMPLMDLHGSAVLMKPED